MPIGMDGMGAAAAPNGKVYAIGGSSNICTMVQTVDGYDPGTNSWSTLAPMPTGRTQLGVVTGSDGRIYAIGGNVGCNPDHWATTAVEQYDPVANTWATKKPMSTYRYRLATAATTDGKIFAAGGSTWTMLNASPYFQVVPTLDVYDIASDTWTRKANMPTTRSNLGMATATNGKIYAVGGTDATGYFLTTVEEYDPATDTWATKAPMHAQRANLTVVASKDGKIYAIGGQYFDETNTSYYATVEEYDPGTDVWTTVTPMITARSAAAASVASNGKVYVLGGDNTNSFLGNNEEGTLPSNPPTTTPTATLTPTSTATTTSSVAWSVKQALPSGTDGLGAAGAPNGKIYAIGGASVTGSYQTVTEFDPAANSWIVKTQMPTARSLLAVVTGSDGLIYAIGGYRIDGINEPSAIAVEQYDPIGDTWTTKSSMPTYRYLLGAAATVGGRIYAAGGITIVADSLPHVDQNFEMYDIASDTWTRKANMPTARSSLGMATATNGKIYAVGGIDATGYYLRTVEEYDPATDTWATKTPLRTQRAGLAVVASSNGKLYAIGGEYFDGSTTTYDATVEEYDPTADTWTTVTPMTIPRGFLAAAVATNGKVYVLGGDNATSKLATNEEGTLPATTATVTPVPPPYTPTPTATTTLSMSWTTRTGLQTAARGLGSAAAPNGKVYEIGGYYYDGTDHYLQLVNEYDPGTDTWTPKAAMPTGRTYLEVVKGADGLIYAIGGIGTAYGSGQAVNKLERFDPVANTWVTMKSMSTSRGMSGAASTLDGKIYVAGGFTGFVPPVLTYQSLEVYDIASDTWTRKSNMPTSRQGLGMATSTNGKIYAVGGVDATGYYLRTVEEYNPATDTWTAKAPMHTQRANLAVIASSNGKIYAIGGQYFDKGTINHYPTVEEYDPTTDTWTTVTPMTVPRADLAAAVATNGRVYVLGGYSTSGYIAANEEGTFGQ